MTKINCLFWQKFPHLDVHDAGPSHPHGGVLNHHELAVFLGARPIEAWYERLELFEAGIGRLGDCPVELDLSLSSWASLGTTFIQKISENECAIAWIGLRMYPSLFVRIACDLSQDPWPATWDRLHHHQQLHETLRQWGPVVQHYSIVIDTIWEAIFPLRASSSSKNLRERSHFRLFSPLLRRYDLQGSLSPGPALIVTSKSFQINASKYR